MSKSWKKNTNKLAEKSFKKTTYKSTNSKSKSIQTKLQLKLDSKTLALTTKQCVTDIQESFFVFKHYSWYHSQNDLIKIRRRRSRIVTLEKLKKQYSVDKKQKGMMFLRKNLKSKLPYLFFQPWKKAKLALTKKQQWLNVAYNKYRFLRRKDRINFFKTHTGQMLLFTELHSQFNTQSTTAPWLTAKRLWKKSKKQQYKVPQTLLQPLYHQYFDLKAIHRKGWWYDNLMQKKKTPISMKKFALDRPNTAFQNHWKQRKLEPWKDSLLFKRALYSGFGERVRKENKFNKIKMKFYLRRKNPRQEKRNWLYQRNTKFLGVKRYRNRIRKNKAARIKQIAGKILRPFYGDLRLKQVTQLVNKSKKIKSNFVSRNEILLNRLESRLDVVVYRLNFAPSILWARRLILGGSIFVSTVKQTPVWGLMYSSLKKFAFPLKLRDPKNLYAQTLWNPYRRLAKYKFLCEPKTKISYLVQPEDIIQCSGNAFMNNFKNDSFLLQKPIPSHFVSNYESEMVWDWRFQKYEEQSFNSWEKPSETINSAVFLYVPKFENLHPKDRVQESFFRWAFL